MKLDLAPAKQQPGPQGYLLFPNDVVREPRVSWQLLNILAYRFTFVGAYGLNAGEVKRHVGLGRDAFEGTLREGRELGLLSRHQPPPLPDGTPRRAQDSLTLPKCGASGRAGKVVRRSWFEGDERLPLTAKERAVLLYLRAGTGKGPAVYVREICKRFGWHRQTVSTILRTLVDKDFAARKVDRTPGGQFGPCGFSYVAKPESEWPRAIVENTIVENTIVEKPGHILNIPQYTEDYISPSEIYNQSPSTNRSYTPSPGEDVATALLWDEAFTHEALLGNYGPERWSNAINLSEVSDESIEAIAEIANDDDLTAALVKATANRMKREIVSPGGLHAVRILAAYVLEQEKPYGDDLRTPQESLQVVVQAIWDRIGSRPGQHLNSLSLIANRLQASASTYGIEDRIYQQSGPTERKPPRPPSRPPSHTIRELLDAFDGVDHCRVLARRLKKETEGLQQLINDFGAQAVKDTIMSGLIQAAVGGKARGSVRSWSYFRSAIEEAIRLAEMERQGLRPGDVPGWRNA